MHTYISVNLVVICLGNGLSLVQCQATTWSNNDLLLVEPLETNLGEMWMEKNTFKEMFLEILLVQDVSHFVQAPKC